MIVDILIGMAILGGCTFIIGVLAWLLSEDHPVWAFLFIVLVMGPLIGVVGHLASEQQTDTHCVVVNNR